MADPSTDKPAAAAADAPAATNDAGGAAPAAAAAADSAPAPTELGQQPKTDAPTESLRPGGGALRPQRYGKGDAKSGGGASNGGASNRSGSGGAAASSASTGSGARRPYGKVSTEPKPKPQPAAAAEDDDGGAAPAAAAPEPEKVAPKTEADAKTADGLHRLQSTWTFWFDKPQGHPGARRVKGTTASTEVYESSLREVGTFDTVEAFWRHFNFMKKPSDLEVGANYHLFKNGIKPMWEDKNNAGGGKWQVRVKDRQSLDDFWQNLVLALVGEMADENDEICGCVMSKRRGGDRLAVWTRRKDDGVRNLGVALKQLMLEDKKNSGVQLEFSYHESSMKSGSSYATDVVYTV